MEKLEVTLYEDSIKELTEYKSLLKANSELNGMSSENYDLDLEHFVRFAIQEALRAESELNNQLNIQKNH
ncbi:hypothetical protein ABE021_10105 [Sporosarcina gallistercoris]|uniref:hypothetical protein n=1 Tax=Sporosarcina gallistercoris TaxID=2762245 RepID=UPI003D29C5A5